MNFQPRIILAPAYGRNADTKVISVRVMNDAMATPQQLGELAYSYHLHQMRVAASLAGYMVHSGELSDRSMFRMVSNSGQHTLMLWPAGGRIVPEAPSDWFVAVPTSDAARDGEGDKPSRSWKVSLSGWPATLRPVNEIPDHPGHVTWSNPSLTFAGAPLVLSWRGPRDRYAATTGFTNADGGGITAHEKRPTDFPSTITDLGANAFTDSGFVWINGHKVNTGLEKVVAACLHQYDPDDHPGQFVLRVATDLGPSSTRKMSVYDLVPSGATDGGLLEAFATATAALDVKANYIAAEHDIEANFDGSSTTPGNWDYWQRPHFNRSGTRIAMLVCMVGTSAIHESRAVSFDPTTWTIDDNVVAQVTGTWTTDYVGVSVPYSSNASNSTTRFVACDFDGDDFVYVKHVAAQEFSETGQSDGQAVPSTTFLGHHEFDEEWTYTVEHSTLGVLCTNTVTTSYAIEYRITGPLVGGLHPLETNYDYTLIGASRQVATGYSFEPPFFTFIGDLSKGSFAIGYRDNEGSYTATGGFTGYYADYPPIPTTWTRTPVKRMVFDIYFDGVRVATGTTGSFANSSRPAATTGGQDETTDLATMTPGVPHITTTTDTNGHTARFLQVSPASPPSFEGRYGSISGTSERAAVYSEITSAPMLQHCAVHHSKKAAYFGGAYYAGTYGTSNIVQGVETTVVATEPPTVENAPVYIAGPHPTMSAPVFIGMAVSGAAT